MAMSFNFNNIKRRYWKVTLKDNRSLTVKMPTKEVFDAMAKITGEQNSGLDIDLQMDEIHSICCSIINNNMERVVLKRSDFDDYDLEESMSFITEFSTFISSLQNDPN
ncbi:MAG: hypothetical protein LKF53_02700 [Solobacterium sp.]|jgi:hypothetical protein|nr:hypothetical protein [Solobacterium sp.]MCH4205288.1 hypothetical protein [Solobacterium sp.]MCH4226881.1 hypothetical protein [Solobacterium sp.]MCH4281641.1 hypothetical protein [Solobacterium sp.]